MRSQKSHFLVAEKATISPDALRLRITLGVTSLSITWCMSRGGDSSSLVCDVVVMSTWRKKKHSCRERVRACVLECTLICAAQDTLQRGGEGQTGKPMNTTTSRTGKGRRLIVPKAGVFRCVACSHQHSTDLIIRRVRYHGGLVRETRRVVASTVAPPLGETVAQVRNQACNMGRT